MCIRDSYSRYLDGREEGDPPGTLLDFFPQDALFFIDVYKRQA